MSASFLDVSVSCSYRNLQQQGAAEAKQIPSRYFCLCGFAPLRLPLVRIWVPTTRKHWPGSRPYHLCSDRMSRFNNHIFFAFFSIQAPRINPAKWHAWGMVGQDNCIRKVAFPSAFRTNPGVGRGQLTRSSGSLQGRTVYGHQDTASKTPSQSRLSRTNAVEPQSSGRGRSDPGELPSRQRCCRTENRTIQRPRTPPTWQPAGFRHRKGNFSREMSEK
jgi:hypothetical protein